MQIKSRIAFHREAHAWTQEDLAIASGVPQSRISAYESGKITPSIPTLIKIADAVLFEGSDWKWYDLIEVVE